jgi:hypothetical protein
LGAQDSTSSKWEGAPTLELAGFLDVFYVYDFNQPTTVQRQPFLFNHNRHQEFNINLGTLGLGVTHAKYRAQLTLQTGTYANDNYAQEPGVLKAIFEARVGVALNRKNTLWLDAGVLPSYIGFESVPSIANWTLTRSLLAENSPYFVTGAKLTYSPSPKWEMAVLALNGWQRIQRVPGNTTPAVGTQLLYKPSAATTYNWSTFVGTDDPDSARRMRLFNNFYGQWQWNRWGFIAGLDVGFQQATPGSGNYEAWWSPVAILKYAWSPRWTTGLRAEYYHDPEQVIVTAPNPIGFKTTGLSINADYLPTENIALRLEGRWLGSTDPIFIADNQWVRTNFIVAASLAVRFARRFQPEVVAP